jgi:hypothetical protein
MRKGFSLRVLAGVVVLCFAMAHPAKADSITGVSVTGGVQFTGVDVYDVNTNSASNPFGVTASSCPGTAPSPCFFNLETTAGTGTFEVATITFFSDGGFIINPTTGSNATGSASGHTSGTWENGTAPASSIFTASGTTLGGLSAGGKETANPSTVPAMFCANQQNSTTGWCFNGNDQGGVGILQYLGNTDPKGISGVFTATDNSEEVVFALTSAPTSTPEPSSLLMLGSGLLGLMGWGLRRKSVV